MLSAETPRLHDPLARHELNLPALDPAAEELEGLAFTIHAFGRLSCCGAEQAAVGEQLEHLLRRCCYERFLMDRHLPYLHTPARVNVTCVTPLGEEVAST
jgi:hypothetical protein